MFAARRPWNTRYVLQFIAQVSLSILITALFSAPLHAKKLAITFDDGFDISTTGDQAVHDNHTLLNTLEAHDIRSMIFPSGPALAFPENLALIRDWGLSGHAIGNHTFSHAALSETDTQSYLDDIVRAQDILEAMPGWCPRLRLPYLDEGKDPQQHHDVMAWLGSRGYGVAPATITLADWDYAARYLDILKAQTPSAAREFRQHYISKILEQAAHEDRQWRDEIQRRPLHVLLLHTNHLNASILNDLLSSLKHEGWIFIDATKAFTDPIYQRTVKSDQPNSSASKALPIPVC